MKPGFKSLKSLAPDLFLKSGLKPLKYFTSLKPLKFSKSMKSGLKSLKSDLKSLKSYAIRCKSPKRVIGPLGDSCPADWSVDVNNSLCVNVLWCSNAPHEERGADDGSSLIRKIFWWRHAPRRAAPALARPPAMRCQWESSITNECCRRANCLLAGVASRAPRAARPAMAAAGTARWIYCEGTVTFAFGSKVHNSLHAPHITLVLCAGSACVIKTSKGSFQIPLTTKNRRSVTNELYSPWFSFSCRSKLPFCWPIWPQF